MPRINKLEVLLFRKVNGSDSNLYKIASMRKILIFLCLISFNTTIFAQQLVLRGDHPDPSVVKIGDSYWATATTSNWFPAYPLLKSTDLVHWKSEGYVFNQLPSWADFYFWAPEISYDNGKVYIYYAAHKKGGNLCLGIASADKPEGPFTDHGPLMCQEAGSIDAFPMRDENGKLYVIWKEDGNSVNKPTPIWAQQLNEQRTGFVGDKKALFQNDKVWEGNLVEGVSMIKRGEYFYAFYAAAGCCGRECSYQTGVARSKELLGPWEKYNNNPVLSHDDKWRCPGHGTPIEKDGKYYFLYHAYNKETNVYTGREGMLMEFGFTPDGWVKFIKDTSNTDVALTSMTDNFSGKKISDNWQWSVFSQLDFKQKAGNIILGAQPSQSGAFMGIKTTSGNYNAVVKLRTKRTNANAGIGLIGDEKNAVTELYKNGTITIFQLKDGKETVVNQKPISIKNNLYLRMQVANGKDISFLFSLDGHKFSPLNSKPVDGGYLPPWDRALRIGLVAKGNSNQIATFDKFELINN